MASIVNFFLQQVVQLPDKFYLVDADTFGNIKGALNDNVALRDRLAALPMYTREEFVKQASSAKSDPANDKKRQNLKHGREKILNMRSQQRREVKLKKKLTLPVLPLPPPSNMSDVATNYTSVTSTASNISENVTFKRRDLLYILDQLIKSRNECYLLRTRQEAYEHVLKWCFQFLTFVQAFSTLVFHNGLPISAVIFNTDMFNVPFSLFDYIERKMQRLESDLDGMYKSIVWTQNGTVVSRTNTPTSFTFRNPEMNTFLANVERIRRDYSAFAEAYNQPNDFVTRGLVDIIPDADERTRLVAELRALCAKYNMNDFSPQYLLQQSHLASLLMHFATTIYSFVPQLQVDFTNEDNFEFSLSKYLARLKEFWQKQTNLSIGPFHVHYSHTNMNRLREVDLARMYAELVGDRADYTNLSVECQQTLSQLTFSSLNRHVSLQPELKLSNTWRNLFNDMIRAPDAHADVTLFRKFMEFATSSDNMFSTRVLVKFDRIFANDYLANLVYNFREQVIILKLIVVQLIVRFSLPPGAIDFSYMNMHDPIMALKDRLNI